SPPAPASKEVWKKGGRMFSILLAVHLALLACTLVSSGAFEKIAVHDYDVFFLLTVMMLVVIIWIIFYLAGTSRCPGAILGKDSHAGPIWLRGGLILFAIFSLVMDVFKIGYYSSFYSCLSAIKIIYPIVQAIFVIVQLWIMPAFGARPQFDNDTELNFYGDSMWPAIVDICLPFGIFYRMHAVASLLEVYIMS
uniref:Otopetrin 2 n=1 Tax=Ficedula albicollis TaxID=59894 RepID=A0A803WD89_FICAL